MPRTKPPITSFPWLVSGYCPNPWCVRYKIMREIKGDQDFKRSQFKCPLCGARLHTWGNGKRWWAGGPTFKPLIPEVRLGGYPGATFTLVIRSRNGRAKRIKLGQHPYYPTTDISDEEEKRLATLPPVEYGRRCLIAMLRTLGAFYYDNAQDPLRFRTEEGTRYEVSSDPESPFHRYVASTVWPVLEQAITERGDAWQREHFPPLSKLGKVIDDLLASRISESEFCSEFYLQLDRADGTTWRLGNEALVTSPGQTIEVKVKVDNDVYTVTRRV